MPDDPALSIILPAHDAAAAVDTSLRALLASRGLARAEVIVAAHGCRDETRACADALAPAFAVKGWDLRVIGLEACNGPAALDAADGASRTSRKVYLHPGVAVSGGLLAQMAAALEPSAARFVQGRLALPASDSMTDRACARIHAAAPCFAEGSHAAGLFGLNAAARARWATWPQTIAADAFARISVSAAERCTVPATYGWPLVPGWQALADLRQRQILGARAVRRGFPDLMCNEDRLPVPMVRRLSHALALAARDPVGFGVYARVTVAALRDRARSQMG